MGVTPSNWTVFFENEFKEGVKESHQKKSENKKKCTIPHTLGRRTYANKCDLLVSCIHSSIILVFLKLYFFYGYTTNMDSNEQAEEDGMVTEDREYTWMKGREKCDETVHLSAVEKYEQVKAAYEKRKEGGTDCSYDFDSDGLVDVFGQNKVNKCNSPVIRLKKVMAQNISSVHPTSEETILDDSCTPNSEFPLQKIMLLPGI
ncbi:uncharacterized protein LOC113310031 isoform X2 [Papaver somniferum]|uniref:uncharacterized protein LOC113310031 isoform X2 n=1 Tax=Papaver somniferum TaxID=3469 RepID=UPI000E6FD56D|nr:uncharacterized protein LOC113310031 isoform X2 [Papaver somniferum]